MLSSDVLYSLNIDWDIGLFCLPTTSSLTSFQRIRLPVSCTKVTVILLWIPWYPSHGKIIKLALIRTVLKMLSKYPTLPKQPDKAPLKINFIYEFMTFIWLPYKLEHCSSGWLTVNHRTKQRKRWKYHLENCGSAHPTDVKISQAMPTMAPRWSRCGKSYLTANLQTQRICPTLQCTQSIILSGRTSTPISQGRQK